VDGWAGACLVFSASHNLFRAMCCDHFHQGSARIRAGPMLSFGVKEGDRTVLGKNRRGPRIKPWGTPVFT
jgi:hypothetical protein